MSKRLTSPPSASSSRQVRDFIPVVRHSADGRVVRGRNGLRIAPLPTDRFCSGHMVWVQQASRIGSCLSVHATFTEYGDAGKRWRFLEAGLWGLLPKEYYTEGRYLTFVPPPPQADPQPCAAGQGVYVVGQTPEPCGGEDPNHGLKPYPAGVGIMGHEAYKRSSRLRANMDLMGQQVRRRRWRGWAGLDGRDWMGRDGRGEARGGGMEGVGGAAGS